MQQMKQIFLQYNVNLYSIYFVINGKLEFREYFSMIIDKYYYFRKILTSEIF